MSRPVNRTEGALKWILRESRWPCLGLVVSCFLLVSTPLLAATGDVISTFAAPGTGPYGLAWDGTNLWLADRDADLIHEVTTTGIVVSSIPTPGADPTGLTWDGTNLWLVDEGTDLIYELDPADGSVLSSIPTPGPEPTGLTWDGTNLWLADINTDLIYELNTTGTVLSSFAAPWNLPRGLAWDSANLWNANGNIYELTTTGTELSFFFSPFVNGQTGLTFDGTDFWLAQDVNGPNNTIYQLEGPGGAATSSVSGTVFEDVNYGGGMGRDLATAVADAPTFTVARGGVTVELYDAAGSFLSSTTTAVADGSYSFTGLAPANYTVRVVNDTVTSSRPGSDGSELGVQTYRIDGVSEGAGDGARKVGGELPSNEDAAANSGAQTLASLQGTDLDLDGVPEWTQSIVTVDSSGGDVTGVAFGFNFDTVVNTNDAGQGSMRQFILNANLLN